MYTNKFAYPVSSLKGSLPGYPGTYSMTDWEKARVEKTSKRSILKHILTILVLELNVSVCFEPMLLMEQCPICQAKVLVKQSSTSTYKNGYMILTPNRLYVLPMDSWIKLSIRHVQWLIDVWNLGTLGGYNLSSIFVLGFLLLLNGQRIRSL